MEHVLFQVYWILQVIVLLMLGLPVLYILFFSVMGLFYKQPPYPEAIDFRRIAVLIPGYKEDGVIIHVANEALKQEYPTYSYDVVIVADSFRQETLDELKKLPLKLIEVKFDKSTKSKALNEAMRLLEGHYDIAVVLDADNIMAPDFLSKVNSAFESRFIAVQGHRMAKNLDTSLAVLDAVSEEINNHIFRKGHRVTGLSSAIIGSGMAFRYSFFKDLMSTVSAIGGFDKEIELKMLKDGHRIEYLDDARVQDEKVQKAEVFTNQRRRWLSAQLHYFRQDIGSAVHDLIKKGNIDYFDKAIQFIQPPRILLLGMMVIATTIFLVVNYLTGAAGWLSIAWSISAISCILALAFSVPRSFYNLTTLKALLSLPGGMLLMAASLLRIKGANRQFIHTSHGVVNPVKQIH
jgi:cellulose synthase/poly-beta-1,6-N-acetylglucosamine synthase-like glycosyltransferase